VTVGQLFVTGTPATGLDPATRVAVAEHHVGGVMLRERSSAGVRATAALTRELQGLATRQATGGRPLLVATDQEGGQVQVLSGPGFDEMPSALEQGSAPAGRLERDARRWGGQLRAAGIHLNLGPVLDTVPSPEAAPGNGPIGAFDRQFGYDPERVAGHGIAFLRGMERARVASAVKHFPGLGRVRGNTDAVTEVHDTATTAHDPFLRPFAAAIRAGAPVVMMSSATYDRIDPSEPACWSREVVTGLLRQRLGFDGVVVSDDLSEAAAAQVRPPAQRAVDFLRAGGDLVLALDPGHMAEMTDAVLAEARRDPAFARQVQQSLVRVQALRAAYL